MERAWKKEYKAEKLEYDYLKKHNEYKSEIDRLERLERISQNNLQHLKEQNEKLETERKDIAKEVKEMRKELPSGEKNS